MIATPSDSKKESEWPFCKNSLVFSFFLTRSPAYPLCLSPAIAVGKKENQKWGEKETHTLSLVHPPHQDPDPIRPVPALTRRPLKPSTVAGRPSFPAHQFVCRQISGGSASCNCNTSTRREAERIWLGLAGLARCAPDLDPGRPWSLLPQHDVLHSLTDRPDNKQRIHIFLIWEGFICKMHLY
jgi:hypothetical protein